MKICTDCAENKSLKDFYAHPKTLDGRMGICKECHKSRVRHRRRTNPAVQAYDRERYKLPHRKEAGARIARKWNLENPEGYRAHYAVSNAVRDGRLFKQPCVTCGSKENLHAHHADYSKPLEVTWYCALHHHRHHHD